MHAEVYGFPATSEPVVVNSGDEVMIYASSSGGSQLQWIDGFGYPYGNSYQNITSWGVEGTYTLQIPQTPGYYSICVQTANSCSGFSYSNQRCIIFQVIESFYFLAYPNPTSEELNIEVKENQKAVTSTPKSFTIELFNAQGTLIKNETVQQSHTKLNIKELPEGIYYMSISNQKSITRRRIVVKR